MLKHALLLALVMVACKKDSAKIDSLLVGRWAVCCPFAESQSGIVLKSDGRILSWRYPVYGHRIVIFNGDYEYAKFSVINDSIINLTDRNNNILPFKYHVDNTTLSWFMECGGMPCVGGTFTRVP